MLEFKFKSIVVERLKAVGAVVLNVHGHGMQAAGWPDTQVYHKLWCGHLEFKVEGRIVEPHQRLILRKLRDQNFPAFVLRWVEGDFVLERWDGLHLETLECDISAADLMVVLRRHSPVR